MADETTTETTSEVAAPAKKAPAKRAAKKATATKTAAKKAPAKRAAKKAAPAADDAVVASDVAVEATEESAAPTKKAPAKRAPRKSAAAVKAEQAALDIDVVAVVESADETEAVAKAPAKKAAAKKAPAKKAATRKPAAKKTADDAVQAELAEPVVAPIVEETVEAPAVPEALFQAPTASKNARRRTRKAAAPKEVPVVEETPEETDESLVEDAVESAATVDQHMGLVDVTQLDVLANDDAEADAAGDENDEDEDGDSTPARRRRRRGGRRRRKASGSNAAEGEDDESGAEGDSEVAADDESKTAEADEADADEASDADASEGGTSRRRRRRRRSGESNTAGEDDPENTVVRVRESRPLEQQITAVSGSTRLEAKKQRRREGREAGRRRAPIVSEAEFLARREAVDRVMVVRQREDLTQIGVLEDKVLVEHYVAREAQTSMIGNIYLGRVQNVLPSMEAAFVDIGKGRNAVLYAGEVNWAGLGHRDGQARKIESVLSSGQTVLVQVTKDPVGHKGARLTSQISLAGRFLVYVPDGTTSGISRKLPDTERARLKSILKEIVPDSAGVIVRTAAEGATEEELTQDVERLKARWEDIEAKASSKSGNAQLLYGEPDLTLKVVRDLFTEDFTKLIVQGTEAWETVRNYVDHVAPDLSERVVHHEVTAGTPDLFSVYRIDEQIAKGLDRKVWLPSGGSLVIDRTEAMTVVDVNTGKFTGSGGNLEETVTKNNLEAAEEIVRQLRLRDIGGIIVVDFIDMVLESNRDLVLRRMVECLGRDRTRHQVAEVTSLGLVQMTRKRIGTGLVEAFSDNCSHCHGRGIVLHEHPVATSGAPQVEPDEAGSRSSRRRRNNRRGQETDAAETKTEASAEEKVEDQVEEPAALVTPKDLAAKPTVETPAKAVSAPVAAPAAPQASEAPVVVEAPTEAPVVETVAENTVTSSVVVRSRSRRGASRSVISTGPAAVVEVSSTDVAPIPVLEVAPPKVVTRTRRGASRDVVRTREE